MSLKREGIIIDDEMIKTVCSEMVEEEEDDNNLGWGWQIDKPCDDLRISNVAEEGEECPSVVEAEPQFENETFTMKSMIEDDLTDSSNIIQQVQQENEIAMIDDIIETHSTQTIDDYTFENNYELNGIISFSSPTTYDEYPQETKYFEIEVTEDYSIFNENLNDGDYDYMIDDHSIPLFDEYSQKSDDDYMIKNDSPPIFYDYNYESEEFNTIEKESSLLFDDCPSENEYMEIEIIEDNTLFEGILTNVSDIYL